MTRRFPIRHALAGLLAGMLCIFHLTAWAGEDVVLLLNNSASMRNSDPHHLVEPAVAGFVNHRGPGTHIAIIAFAATATRLVPLVPADDANRKHIREVLTRLDYRGHSTDVANGLEQALYELVSRGNSGAQKCIILISGGLVHTGSKSIDLGETRWIMQSLLPAAVYNHVRIFTVAVTQRVNDKLLQTLAETTGGGYFQALHARDLDGIFKRISATLAVGGLAATPALPGINAPNAAQLPPIRPVMSSKFNTPLTHAAGQPEDTGWLWLAGLLALIAAAFGIYAAWNMRLIKRPQKLLKPEMLHTEGPRAVLYDISNPNDIKRFELAEKATIIGRVAGYDPEVQYVLVKEKTVGRCHAVIERRGHSFWIMDQGSINGTFVNGENITADRALKHGDIVAIHRHEFEFMIPEYFESESTVVGVREPLTG